ETSIAEPGAPSLPGVGHASVQNFSDSPGKPSRPFCPCEGRPGKPVVIIRSVQVHGLLTRKPIHSADVAAAPRRNTPCAMYAPSASVSTVQCTIWLHHIQLRDDRCATLLLAMLPRFLHAALHHPDMRGVPESFWIARWRGGWRHNETRDLLCVADDKRLKLV